MSSIEECEKMLIDLEKSVRTSWEDKSKTIDTLATGDFFARFNAGFAEDSLLQTPYDSRLLHVYEVILNVGNWLIVKTECQQGLLSKTREERIGILMEFFEETDTIVLDKKRMNTEKYYPIKFAYYPPNGTTQQT